MRRIIVSTSTNDPALAFVGSSWSTGDTGSLGIVLPPDPTTSARTRYLCRLCAAQIPGRRFRVVNLRQYLTLGWESPPDVQPPTPPVVLELDALRLGPHFRFPDGNVSWHLMRSDQVTMQEVDRAGQIPGWSKVDNDLGPAILYQTLPVSLGGPGYVPLNDARPFGDGLTPWGHFHDIRFPWTNLTGASPNLCVEGAGPCTVAFYASVYQTNPETRPSPLPGGLLPPETLTDQIVALGINAVQTARFWRIAGEMTIETEE